MDYLGVLFDCRKSGFESITNQQLDDPLSHSAILLLSLYSIDFGCTLLMCDYTVVAKCSVLELLPASDPVKALADVTGDGVTT